MADGIEILGGCRCGQVRYTISLDGPPRTYACHCSQCKASTGSAFALQLPVETASVQVRGQLATADYVGSRGAISTHHFCATCLTRLYGINTSRPGLTLIRAGTLDESQQLSPVGHIFVAYKQPWIVLPQDVPAFEEGPPLAEWMKIIAPDQR